MLARFVIKQTPDRIFCPVCRREIFQHSICMLVETRFGNVHTCNDIKCGFVAAGDWPDEREKTGV